MGRILIPNAHPRSIRIYSRSRRSTEFPVDQPRSDLVCVSSGFHEFPVVENRVTGHQRSKVVVHWEREVIDELNRREWTHKYGCVRWSKRKVLFTSIINFAPIGSFTPRNSFTRAFHTQQLFNSIVFCLSLSSFSAPCTLGSLVETCWKLDCRGPYRSVNKVG